MRQVVGYLVIVAVSVLAFEALVWFGVPQAMTHQWEAYRRPEWVTGLGYPQHYFAPHPERGFDLKPGASGRHYVHDLGAYEVWANELGCYDKPFNAESYEDGYVYLAGDSFTWGFVPYDAHFAELMEPMIRTEVMRCGVTNTAQRHQFHKFLEVTTKVGKLPDLVIVNYVANDIADDYAHPQATVKEGWMVPRVELDGNNQLVELPEKELSERLALALSEPEYSAADQIKRLVLRYSASANIVRSLLRNEGTLAGVAAGSRSRNQRGAWMLFEGHDGPYPWSASRFSQRNREALLAWQAHADAHGYELLVSVIGLPTAPEVHSHFAEMTADLRAHGLKVSDSSIPLSALPDPQALYAPANGHFNELGHKFYAEHLSKALVENGLASLVATR